LIVGILKAESELETAKHKLNNDRSYIRLLHEYNYLKVRKYLYLMHYVIGCSI
jgi:hypothetical protein